MVASLLDGVTKMSFSQIITPVLVDTTTPGTGTTPTTTSTTTTTTTTTTTPAPTPEPTGDQDIATVTPPHTPEDATQGPSGGDGPNLLAIILPVILVVIIIVLLIILLLYCYRKKQESKKADKKEAYGFANQGYSSLPQNMKWNGSHNHQQPPYMIEIKEPRSYISNDIIYNRGAPKVHIPQDRRQRPLVAPPHCKITVDDMNDHYLQLLNVNPETNKTYLKEQFEELKASIRNRAKSRPDSSLLQDGSLDTCRLHKENYRHQNPRRFHSERFLGS